MNKDFDKWNINKKKIDSIEYTNKKFKEGEIWWCSAGLNIGHEIDGKHETFERPFYILKKCNEGMFIGLSCTSNFKKVIYMYHLVTTNLDFVLNFSQIRIMSSKRLLRKVSMVRNRYEEDIREKFIDYIKRKSTH